MRQLNVKVYTQKIPGGTSYAGGYPKAWHAESIPFLVYGDKGTDERGDFHWVLATVPDDLYEILKNDPACFEVTQQEAVEIGNRHRPQIDKVLDQNKVVSVLSKQARGIALTQEDLDVIDPEKPAKGLNRSKSFEEISNDYGVVWGNK